ncbi:response regulator transcription factor [Wolinella succinogenes]|uniref:response regulator transcription factor n=1 Tax=Wolinella succinogenes TaxID=844 RepID=UPI0016A21100|nr:response regulator transcription factor [Wolinella succinogenes]NLU34457.1 response regulator transcription factor [Wolinella succinogenes]
MKSLKRFNLLFLEDNETFARHMLELLSRFFAQVFHAKSMKGALELLEREKIHAILSDIRIEDGNALEFISKIRQQDTHIPITVLSAHKDEDFLLKAIPLGLGEYLIKPVEFEVLMASLGRMAEALERLYGRVECFGENLGFYKEERVVIKGEERCPLTPSEARLLELLLAHRGRVLSKEQLEEWLYPEGVVSDSALKNLVLRLRKKIGQESIENIPQIGYKISK